MFLYTAMEDFSQKETVRRYSAAHARTNRCKGGAQKKGGKIESKGLRPQERYSWIHVFIPNHFDLCETAASLMKKETGGGVGVGGQFVISSTHMFTLSLSEIYPGAFKGFWLLCEIRCQTGRGLKSWLFCFVLVIWQVISIYHVWSHCPFSFCVVVPARHRNFMSPLHRTF